MVSADGSESGLVLDLEAAVLAVAPLALLAVDDPLFPASELSLVVVDSFTADFSLDRPLSLLLRLWDLVRVLRCGPVRGLARAPVDVVPLTVLLLLLLLLAEVALLVRWLLLFCDSIEALGKRERVKFYRDHVSHFFFFLLFDQSLLSLLDIRKALRADCSRN